VSRCKFYRTPDSDGTASRELKPEDGQEYWDSLKKPQSSGDASADLMAILFEKSGGNIEGSIKLYETFSLDKIQKILGYWAEITMSDEDKEKRVRAEGDKIAKRVSERMSDINLDKEELIAALPQGEVQLNPADRNEVSDPESVKRYLEMIGKI